MKPSLRRSIAILLVALVATAALAAPAAAKEPATKEQVEELMELTGARDMGRQMGNLMAEQFFAGVAANNPSIPPETKQLLANVTIGILDDELPSLIERTVPLYQRYFTKKEMGELIAFYRSPIGRKTISVMPQLMQESMAIGRQWALELQPEVEKRLRLALNAEGLI